MKGKPNFSSRFLFSKNMMKRYGFILKSRKKTSQKKPILHKVIVSLH